MRVRIMNRHPISNPDGPTCWDGKVHDLRHIDAQDIRRLGEWLTSKTGITYDYLSGRSRFIEGEPFFFPARQTTGVHCQWLERVTESPTTT